MNNHEWLEKAKTKLKRLEKGMMFEVKQLFDPLEWDNLTPKERQGFGRYFSTAYKDGLIQGIHREDDGKRHPNKYIKE